jgi:hypothetical protein
MRQALSIARESFYIAGCLILVAIAIQGCQEAEAKEPRCSIRAYQSTRRITGPDNTVFAIYRRGPMLMASYRRPSSTPMPTR